MANPNIFQQYLKPPRSMAEYGADLDQAEAAKLGLEGQRRQNELSALTADQTRSTIADAATKRNAIQAIYAQLGPNAKPIERARALQSNPITAAEGVAAEKAILDNESTSSQISERQAKTTREQGQVMDDAIKRFRGALDFIDTPQGAARWLQAQYADPAVGQHMQTLGTFEQAVANIPQTPEEFEQWRTRAAVGMEKFLSDQTSRRGQDLSRKTSLETTGMNNATSRANNAATVATQRRGQDLTDARARDTNETQRGLITQEKQLKVNEKLRELDGAVSSTANNIAVIDKALSHPGRETSTGLSGTLDPRNYVPGTDAADFRAVLDQIGGTAFLQAFQNLKGGGQITEVEGKKATDAIARLSRAQSDAEFERSLKDLRQVMTTGYKRLSGQDYEEPAAQSGVPSLSDIDAELARRRKK